MLQFKDTFWGTVGPLCAKHNSSPFTKISKGSEIIAQADENTVTIVAIGAFRQIWQGRHPEYSNGGTTLIDKSVVLGMEPRAWSIEGKCSPTQLPPYPNSWSF